MKKNRNRKTSRFGACILAATLFFSNAYCANDLLFKIALEKNKYLVGEGVCAIFMLINNGPSSVRISPFYMHTGAIEVVLRNDNRMQILPNWRTLSSPALDTIAARDTIIYVQELDSWFGARSPTSVSELRRGSYTIKATYHISSEMSLESEELSFSVDEPTGFEKVAHAEFVHLRQLAFKPEARFTGLENFISKYVSSVYRPRAMALLVYYGSTEGVDLKWRAIAQNLIAEYPNSPFVTDAVSYMVQALPNAEERIEFLRSVSRRIPKTLLGSMVRHSIKAIEKTRNIK